MVKCDKKGCENKAEYNLQLTWQRYSIDYIKDDDGNEYEDYNLDKEWEGGESEFWCDEHYREEMGLK